MTSSLSESQAAALFDILSHYNTYDEIRQFREPGSLRTYGPPFKYDTKSPSTSPALQTLVSRFLLNLPGLKDLPDEFWKVNLYRTIEALEEADLSESYDKGVIGSRKTLSTAISALIEYPLRGTYGGFAKVQDPNPKYDTSNADDLSRAFRDFLDQSIYGTILEDTVKKAEETDRLEDHSQLLQAVHEFVLVNLASFMHYTLILSPKGQYLVKLIDNVNKLVPYVVVRQTLKIGNVASMIGAMVKVGLAKMSIASVTNWMGLTQTEDEGMNLMQQIISTVLSWDNKDLEARASKVEKEKQSLSKDQLAALRHYQDKSSQDHDRLREQSRQESISIITAILRDASVPSDLDVSAHKLALEYLSVRLSIRDRKEIIRILCHSSPDHLTTSVRSLVTAFEPVIRQMHDAINLSDTVWDLEVFLKDMLKLSKVQSPGKDGTAAVPTAGDFVQLLKKHQYSSHKFIHQCCKNGREVTSWYLEWAKEAAAQFRRDSESNTSRGAGDLSEALTKLFANLPRNKQEELLPALDAQAKYLDDIHAASAGRLETVLESPPSKNPAIAKIFAGGTGSRPSSRPASRTSSPERTAAKASAPAPSIDSDPGPGAYLARWQDLLDSTPITPLTPRGKVQKASSEEVVVASAKDVNGVTMAEFPEGKSGAEKVKNGPADDEKRVRKPNVRIIVEALGMEFKKLLAEKSCYW